MSVSSDIVPPKPWERQYNESRQAFEAFRIYRDMGPTRSIAKASETLRKQHRLLEKWSAKWGWIRRATEYDRELDRERVRSDHEAIIAMSKRQAEMAQVFQGKVLERLINLSPDELTPTEMGRWFDVAVKVERLARGLPAETTRTELTGVDGQPIDITSRYSRLQEVMGNPTLRAQLEVLARIEAQISDEVIDVPADS